MMKLLKTCKQSVFFDTEFVLCDLDDTLTHEGKLPAASYRALEDIWSSGKRVIVITGRPAGWCDLIARLWPVAGVVGENGAFYFCYRHTSKEMVRVFQRSNDQRARDQQELLGLFEGVKRRHPKVRLSVDQPYRISDIAIDFCEDVSPLDEDDINDIVNQLREAGATVKVSSIHINAWIGDFSKLEMSKKILADEFGLKNDKLKKKVVYVGDSPNDEPMFEFFDYTVGVSNINHFRNQMEYLPKWVTEKPGGYGFEEIARLIVT